MELNEVDIEFLMRHRAHKKVEGHYKKLAPITLVPLIPATIMMVCSVATAPRAADGTADISTGAMGGVGILMFICVVVIIAWYSKKEKDKENLTKRYIDEAKE